MPSVSKTVLAALCAVSLCGVPRVHAQDSDTGLPQGIDKLTFERLFGEATKRHTPEPGPAKTAEELADRVVELRIFLTPEPNIVIGEIATEGPAELKELSISLEDGPVSFKDDGADPDRTKGDGIFSARFKMDTAAEFETLRAGLKQSAEILRGRNENAMIRRGPRDIVPAGDAMKSFGEQSPEALKNAIARSDLGGRLLEFRDPLEAARSNHIDIKETPFIALPGPRFEIKEFLRFPRTFDVIVLEPFPLLVSPVTVDRDKSLMVNDVGVVEDPQRTFDSCTGSGTAGGAWSFGHLMREMAQGTGITPEEFTRHWLSSWEIDQEANGWLVQEPGRGARLRTTVIRTWEELSGSALNIDMFPARLLAIVNRPDLADKIGYGTAGSAGEGRLVFGLIERDQNSGNCNSLPFTVIFEYGVKGGSCGAVKAWHQKWKDLDQHAIGSAPYNQALETITRAFTDHGSKSKSSA